LLLSLNFAHQFGSFENPSIITTENVGTVEKQSKHFKKTEILILMFLWVGSLTTYPIALFNHYALYPSDYLGIVGLAIVTSIAFKMPGKSLGSVIVLLLLGLFNVLSFFYFINLVVTFGFSFFVTPGIQLISLALLLVLVARKKDKVGEEYRLAFGVTEEDRQQERLHSTGGFKDKFKHLSDRELEARLKGDLVPEAKDALRQLLEERKARSGKD
jgi:hypothetical protein